MKNKLNFNLPNLDKLQEKNSSKVTVIAIIGKSRINSYGLKIKEMNISSANRKITENVIKGLYDEKKKVIYLQLDSLLDTDSLMRKFKAYDDKSTYTEDFLEDYNNMKYAFCKYFLFLLHVSHIVIITHPESTFDTNYVQYLKIMDSLSKKFQEKICNELGSLEMPSGKFTTPKIIFYFDRPPMGVNTLHFKSMEHNLEDQIYRILKKSNIESSDIFIIPPNDEYVFIEEKSSKDKLREAVKGLIRDCSGSKLIEAPFSSESSEEKKFLEFLYLHVYRNQTDDSDNDIDIDSQSSNEYSSIMPNLPSLKHWLQVCKCLYNIIISNSDQPAESICPETTFSEQRCRKVLPLAIARYQEGLPPCYNKVEHEARLGVALSLFRAQARGYKYAHYETQLRSECQAFWENDRQQCEAASLTGNACKLSKHSQEQEHISGVIYKSVCNCGRTTGTREDPYTTIQANLLFYESIANDCQCSELDKLEFPVFEPSTENYKAAILSADSDETLSPFSGQSDQLTPEIQRHCVIKASTTEYLPGMLTLNSPPGLLPIFSSWSLICLGASSLYSHSLGLTESNHPGFLSSTNYLLPWDVTLSAKAKKAWPTYNKHSKGRRGRPTNNAPQSVKLFIGLEYECPSGHRFMLSSPNKMLKATPGSVVKETGQEIAQSDMPLYFQCSCRAAKTAQLMRLHVVTPKAPVYCVINPRIKPAEKAPIFISTPNEPPRISQSAYWVMRLPYVYKTDKHHYKQNFMGKLLKGTFSIVEAEDEDIEFST